MLDQNTDRMWYVIGAVLIGAAIIFGASTMFPSAFASVGLMMSGTLDNISEQTYFEDLYYERALDDFTMYLNQPTSWQQGGILGDGAPSINDFVMRTDYLELPSGRYSLRIDSSKEYNVAMSMQTYSEKLVEIVYDESTDRYNMGVTYDTSGYIDRTDEYDNILTFDVPEEANFVRLRVLYRHPDFIETGNPFGWIKEEWIPEIEVPSLTFHISRHELIEVVE